MKFFLPKTVSYISTNVAENEAEDGSTYTVYNPLLGYNLGHIVKNGEAIYEALTTIYPLAHYVWEDAVITDIHVLNLHTQADKYPVGGVLNVDIVSGVTVFYIRTSGKWYLAKSTGTFDMMLENPTTPAHFDQITTLPVLYRKDYLPPVGTEDTLYWGYNGVANRYRALDRAIGTQTTKFGASLTMSMAANACNALSLFNVYAQTVLISVYDNSIPLTPVLLYTTTLDMVGVSALDTYEKVCTVPATLETASTVFFQARYAQRIDLTFSGVDNPSVGAVKMGLLDYLGVTMDGVDVGIKSYNSMEQRANGDIVWNKDNLETNKVNTLRYNVKLDTVVFDPTALKLKLITDKEVVLLGDDGDPAGYTTLHSYGAIKSADTTLRSNDTKSIASISIENFV